MKIQSEIALLVQCCVKGTCFCCARNHSAHHVTRGCCESEVRFRVLCGKQIGTWSEVRSRLASCASCAHPGDHARNLDSCGNKTPNAKTHPTAEVLHRDHAATPKFHRHARARLPCVSFQLLTIQVDKRQFCYYNHVSMHGGTMSHFTHKICVTRFAHAGCINLHIKNVLTFQPCTHKHS